jgi:hypothetical protein
MVQGDMSARTNLAARPHVYARAYDRRIAESDTIRGTSPALIVSSEMFHESTDNTSPVTPPLQRAITTMLTFPTCTL